MLTLLAVVAIAPPRASAVHLGPTVYFASVDEVRGLALWRTLGTEETTHVVADLPDAEDSIVQLGRVDDRFFFAAWGKKIGGELWVSDGTDEGTHRVLDIRPGPESSAPAYGSTGNGLLFFTADDGIHGREPWVSDGTEAGTVLLQDVRGGERSSRSSPVERAHGLYFVARHAPGQQELWTTDGTPAGTHVVTEFGSDGRVVECCEAVQSGPTLFAAYDDVHGAEIWRTDGTWAGTELVADVSSTITDYYSPAWPNFQARFDGDVLFTQDDGVHGTSLFRTDGTEAGTEIVEDMAGDYDYRWPHGFEVLGGGLLFVAFNEIAERFELWTSDGTGPGTTMVDTIADNPPSWDVYSFGTPVVGDLMFVVYQTSLHVTDGTAEGTRLLRSFPLFDPDDGQIGVVGRGWGQLYFIVDDGVHGHELWVSDGTKAGTHLVKDID